jgi:hypothetical protein
VDLISRGVDRTIGGTIGKQLLFFVVVTGFVFIVLLGISFALYPPEESANARIWNTIFHFMEVGGFEDTAGAGRWLILIVNILGMVLFGGVLISILVNIIERRIDRVKDGEAYYKFNGHIVIIGYDPLCNGLVNRLAQTCPEEIVLQTIQEVPEVRHCLTSNLQEEFLKKVVLVKGNRTSREDLEKLRIADCTQLFLLGETGDEDRDARNIECLGIINEILAEPGKNIRCHVLFDRQSTFTAFQQQDIPGIREHIDFVPFNFCDVWAQKVFVDCQYNNGEVTYLPLDREPVTEDSGKRVHLVILGMSNMGVALGIQAAHLCHFPNFVTKGIKTRITFIDENADRETHFLMGRLRSFFEEVDYSCDGFDSSLPAGVNGREKFTDLEFEFIKARFEEPGIQQYLAEAALREDSILTVAAALDDSSAALACGLYLPSEVYDRGVQVLVRQEWSFATLSMLSREHDGAGYRKYKNVKPFGMLDNCYDPEQADDLLPMMVKYTYDNTKDSESEESVIREFPVDGIRLNWMTNWKEKDNVSALKASNRYCANCVPVRQRSLGITEGKELTEHQIRLAAQVEHNRWGAEKLLLGFRAPTAEEAAAIAADKKQREYFKARHIHEDIKAYYALGKDGKQIDVRIYDINISKALPFMLKAYKRIKEKL